MLNSCTDLDIRNEVDILADDYFQSEEDFILFIAPVYLPLRELTNVGSWLGMQEMSSDEICAPIRGQQWNDEHWVRVHRHQWTPIDGIVIQTWNVCFHGINQCNRLIQALEEHGSERRFPYLAELRAVRAFYYSLLIDAYGSVPIVTSFADVEPPANASRNEVFTFIEQELSEVLTELPKDGGDETYGRMTEWSARALLANLYLNAEKYLGMERWSELIQQTEIIINSNKFQLTDDYFENFRVNNENSAEIIWAIPFDEQFAQGFSIAMATLHTEGQRTYNLTSQPWNGWCTLEDFFNSYSDQDARKGSGRFPGSFIFGTQFSAEGDTLLQDTTIFSLEPEDPDGLPIVHTPKILSLENALMQDGARIGKFEFEEGAGSNMSNDYPIFRYSRILLNHAEGLWRLGRTDVALETFNQVRMRADLEPVATINEEIFLAELGREFFMESYRRSDLIRFGRFTESWWEKDFTDPCRELFPIPSGQLNENPNLIQNPCY